MRIPRLRLVCLLCFLIFLAPYATAQPPKNPVLMEKTQSGVTVRLFSVRWAEVESVMRGGGTGGYPPHAKGLLVSYDVQGKGASVSLKCLDPQGRPVQGSTYYSSGEHGNLIWCAAIDPRWPRAALQFEWVDPKAPPHADGSFSETLVFKDVPLPEQGVVKTVNQTLTTKRGTRVTIEKIALPKESQDYAGQTILIVHALPPRDVPDLMASVQREGAIDNTGKDLGHGGGWSSEDALERRPGRETHSFTNLPSPQAKSLNLKVRVTESIPSLRQEQWYRRVSFDLALNRLPNAAPRAAPPPLSTVKIGDLEAALESFTTQPGNTLEANTRVYSPALPPGQQWALKNFDLRDAAKPLSVNGEEAQREYWASDRSHNYSEFWKPNGAPLRNGEAMHTIHFDKFPSEEAKGPEPQKFNLTATAELVQKTSDAVTFNELPIPQPGQVINLEKAAMLGSGTRLILRKIGYFAPEHPHTKSADSGGFKPPWGFGLVYEIVPVRENASASLSVTEARDDKNRPLNERSGITGTSSDVWQKEHVEGRWWTIFLLPTYPDAKHFNVTLSVNEMIPTGRQEKFTFRDLPAPPQLQQGQ